MIDLPLIPISSIWSLTILDILSPLALLSCAYTFGASLCRLAGMNAAARKIWVHLYVGVFGIAGLSAIEVLHGQATELLCGICICLGLYIKATAPAWANGTPAIATKAGIAPQQTK